MKRLVLTLALTLLPALANAGVLETVRERGQLVCGVSGTVAGFALPDSQGVMRGIDADYCRAVAAAVLGDPNKVRFVPLTAAIRFTALQSAEIDVLIRNTTLTFQRDNTLGLEIGAVTFYDGQGFLVRRESGAKKLADLNGATICMSQGSTHELNISELFRVRGMTFTPIVMEQYASLIEAFLNGRCDVMTQDISALAGIVSRAPDPSRYEILPEAISKEPLGIMSRRGDEQWTHILRWVHNALVEAEELGVTQANVVEQAASSQNPTVQRLLGRSGEFGKALGLDDAWVVNLLKAVGNYGEVFNRNVGPDTPLRLARGQNALWTNGGLMYAIPFR